MAVMKKLLFIMIPFIIIVTALSFLGSNLDWTKRFDKELDRFFGKDWELVEKIKNKSTRYKVYRGNRDVPWEDPYEQGRYTNWVISSYVDGERIEWVITDHVYRISRSKHIPLSPKRYTAKQALVLEFLECLTDQMADGVKDDVAGQVFDDAELKSIQVRIMQDGGNPKPKYYDWLWDQDWFTIADASLDNLFSIKDYTYYVDIGYHDDKLEDGTEEAFDITAKMAGVEELLKTEYGPDLSYSVYVYGKDGCLYRSDY